MSITDFLNARIAEDEAVARAAIEDDGGSDEGFSKQYDKLIQPPSGIGHAQGGFGEAAARMIATYAVPARVLAECAAKRAIVERYERFYATRRANWMNPNYVGAMEELKFTLETLAAVYAFHPDYQDSPKQGDVVMVCG